MKQAGRYIAFFGILLVLIIGACFLFTPFNYDPKSCDKDITKNWLGEEDNSIEMLVMGDSECYTSLDANLFQKQTGVSTFVCASSGLRIVEACHNLAEILHTQSPDYLILETDTMFMDSSLFGEIKVGFVAELENLMQFFRYHGRWKYLTPEVLSGATGTRDPERGFRVYTNVQPYEGGEYMFETDEFEPMNPVNVYYLNRLKKMCDENNITMIMMSAPSPHNWTYKKHNTAEAWGTENNVKFYDLNLKCDEIGIDWQKDILDGGDHMNVYGADKTTAYMAEIFKKEFL